MNIARYLTLACVGSLAFGAACSDDDDDDLCTGDTVVTRTDPAADFTLYTTFAVSPDVEPVDVSMPADVTTNLAVANAAATAQLIALGLTLVAADADPPPDLVLFNIAATQGETGTQWVCTPGYIWVGWYYVWDPCAWMVEVPVAYTEGTLIVGLADLDLSKVVFGGVLQGILECGGDTESRIQSGVARIFQDYPTAD
ncbi:MAG TPA: DUF4136 domain-containing protein [Polyangiaceae bacterium]|jgi:hypothetical protein|nr:DUF4136 domain-containing protein [Polyangiaceae bacterium]